MERPYRSYIRRIKVIIDPLSSVPNLSNHWTWQCFQISVLILPIIPLVGVIGLVIVLVSIWLNQYRQIIRNPLNWGLAIFTLWLIVISGLAYQPVESWLGLANLLPFFCLFAALSILFKQPSQLRRLAWLLIIPSLPIIILGIGQMYAGWSIPNILGWELIPQGVPPGRMSSVFIYTNFLAIYLLLVLNLGLGLSIATYQSWYWSKDKQKVWILLFLIVIVVSSAIALILTSSRNAWGIAIFSSLAFALYLGWRWLVYTVMTAATAIGWASFGPSWGQAWLRKIVPAYFWARLADEIYIRPVETLRITQWQFCLDLIQQRPLTGWGLRNFTPLYQEKMNVWFGHPHSLFLMLTSETGIVGMLILAIIVGWVMMQSILLVSRSNDLSKSDGLESSDLLGDRLIFFTYIIAFTSFILFNLLDVTIFDLRINTIGWILFSAITGIVLSQDKFGVSSWRKSRA